MARIAVLGAGVAGLAAAWELEQTQPGVQTLVLEARSRIGGVVETERTSDGFLVEHGPDAVLTRKPRALDLLEGLGLSDDLLRSSDGPGRTYVVKDGMLRPLPEGMVGMAPSLLWPMLRSPLLSIPAKLRLLCEPWVASAPGDADETVEAFIARRFGRGFLEGIVAPILEGVYGDGATELSARELLPMLVRAEAIHGSVARGLVRAPPAAGTGERRASTFVTPRQGMSAIVQAMAARLRGRIYTQTKVRGLKRRGCELEISLFGGSSTRVDGVIVALPAVHAAPLVESIDADLASSLEAMPHADLQLVTLAYPREALDRELDATGFVAGKAEGRAVRACTWSSQKWSGRAPQGAVLMRCFLHAPSANDQELTAAACDDLRHTLGIRAAPLFTRVRVAARTLPRATVGHAARVAAIRERCEGLENLRLAGSALGTVGVPDCARSGADAARELCAL